MSVGLILLIGLAVITVYNPMRLRFLTSVTIGNPTASPQSLALLGVREGGGIAAIKPVFAKWLPLPMTGRFMEVLSGQSQEFVYDWDDINFCWIAVEAGDGSIRLQRSGLGDERCPLTGERPECCAREADGKVHMLRFEGDLPVATAAHIDALRRAGLIKGP